MSATQVVVTADHHSPENPPIEVRPGDTVDVVEQSAEWPAFVLVRTVSGSGWVPERYLDGSRPKAMVLHPYDTHELPATAGERLTVLEDDPESGWSWCANAAGRTGWVPHEVIR